MHALYINYMWTNVSDERLVSWVRSKRDFFFAAALKSFFKEKFLHLNYDECSHFIRSEKKAYFDRQPDDWHDAEKELNVKEDEI